MTLLAGSRSLMLGVVATILVIAGLALMIKNSRSTGIAFSLPFLIFLGVASTTTQEGSHAGIQIARYGISFFPLSFIAAAVAVTKCGEILRMRLMPAIAGYALPAAGVAAWIPFLATSPLWEIYSYPNNFTNHSCYQYRYEPIQWETASPERDLAPGMMVPYSEIPPFYFNRNLLSEAKGLIEFPMLIGDHFNVYYYYQHFHNLPVVAGFVSSALLNEFANAREFVYGDSPIEYVLASVPEALRSRATWRTMIDLQDIEKLRKRYSGWLMVFHVNPAQEVMRDGAPDLPFSNMVSMYISGNFGYPLYVDGKTIVWKIQ